MIAAIARTVSNPRGKWFVIGAWVVLLAVFAVPGQKLSSVTTDESATIDSLPGDSQAAELADTLKKRFPGGAAMLALSVYQRDGGLTPRDQLKIAADAARIARVEGVGRVVTPYGAQPGLVSKDGSVAFVAAPLTQTKSDDRTDAIKAIRKITGEGGGGLDIKLTGPAALQSDLSTTLQSTDAALLIAVALLVLILLTVIYRSPVIALVPLIVVGVSYTISTGIIYLLAKAFDETIDRTAVTLLAILMFGAGTDYCLLMVARYSSELREHEDKHVAIGNAVRRAAPAIAASGLVVAGALVTLVFARLHSLSIFGPVNAIGILVGLVASLTLLPSMLAAFGRGGFWPSRKQVEKRASRRDSKVLAVLDPSAGPPPEDVDPSVHERDGVWRRVGTIALRRPGVTLAGCVLLLGIGCLGLVKYERDVNEVGQFRTTVDSIRGFDVLQKGFPAGALFPNAVLVDRADGPLRPADVRAAMAAVRSVAGVAQVSAITNRSRDGRAATFAVTFVDNPFKDPALARVGTIRDKLANLGVPGVKATFGDGSAFRRDYRDAASQDQKRVIPLVLLVITLTLILLLRSVVAPLYLLVTVLFSFFATLGISLVVFDVVFGESTVDPVFPIFAFIFLVALGVDYNIFFMHRVREEAQRYGTREGVLRALVATGPVITSAGIILAGTFAVLMTLPLDILLEIGFAVALGVLIDTFIVRTLMVPAIVEIVGDASWWPSKLGPTTGAHATPMGRSPRVAAIPEGDSQT